VRAACHSSQRTRQGLHLPKSSNLTEPESLLASKLVHRRVDLYSSRAMSTGSGRRDSCRDFGGATGRLQKLPAEAAPCLCDTAELEASAGSKRAGEGCR